MATAPAMATTPVTATTAAAMATTTTATMFALTPAAASSDVIDYKTAYGRKVCDEAIAALTKEPFDCELDGLFSFMKALKDRARGQDWMGGTGILDIPEDISDINSKTANLIDYYGTISLEKIKKHEETYIGNTVRAAQDTYNMYQCLMSSISEQGKSKILIWEKDYLIGELVSGNLLLKVIIRESHLDSNATTSSIRSSLANLEEYLPQVGHDITKFNQYVKLMIQALGARGETTQDLLTNLFDGHAASSDRCFKEYIAKKNDEYDEGNAIEPDKLMELADLKFKALKVKGRWNAPSEEEEKILALEAKVKILSQQKAPKRNHTPTKSGRGKKKPEWMSEPPGVGAKTRTWNEKPWHWCDQSTGGKCGGAWRVHKPSECQGGAFSSTYYSKMEKERQTKAENLKKRIKTEGEEKMNTSRTKKKLKLAAAIAASIEETNPDGTYGADGVSNKYEYMSSSEEE